MVFGIFFFQQLYKYSIHAWVCTYIQTRTHRHRSTRTGTYLQTQTQKRTQAQQTHWHARRSTRERKLTGIEATTAQTIQDKTMFAYPQPGVFWSCSRARASFRTCNPKHAWWCLEMLDANGKIYSACCLVTCSPTRGIRPKAGQNSLLPRTTARQRISIVARNIAIISPSIANKDLAPLKVPCVRHRLPSAQDLLQCNSKDRQTDSLPMKKGASNNTTPQLVPGPQKRWGVGRHDAAGPPSHRQAIHWMSMHESSQKSVIFVAHFKFLLWWRGGSMMKADFGLILFLLLSSLGITEPQGAFYLKDRSSLSSFILLDSKGEVFQGASFLCYGLWTDLDDFLNRTTCLLSVHGT